MREPSDGSRRAVAALLWEFPVWDDSQPRGEASPLPFTGGSEAPSDLQRAAGALHWQFPLREDSQQVRDKASSLPTTG